jgi:hypothetical protein
MLAAARRDHKAGTRSHCHAPKLSAWASTTTVRQTIPLRARRSHVTEHSYRDGGRKREQAKDQAECGTLLIANGRVALSSRLCCVRTEPKIGEQMRKICRKATICFQVRYESAPRAARTWWIDPFEVTQ